MRTAIKLICLSGLALSLAACDSGRKPQSRSPVTIVNAAPGYNTVTLIRGGRAGPSNSTQFLFLSGSSVTYEIGTYTFNLETEQPDNNQALRHTPFTQDIAANTSYVFAIVEAGGQLTGLVAAHPVFESANSDAEAFAIHAGPALGGVDVYLEPAGADLALATPLGRMTFQDSSSPASKPPGDYVVTVTQSADPASIMFTSLPQTIAAGQSHAVVVVDGNNPGFTDINVLLSAGGSTLVLSDPSFPTGFRFVNAAADRGARDVYLNGDFSAPAIGNAAFGTVTARGVIPSGSNDVTITPAGNTGVLELEHPLAVAPGLSYTYLLSSTDTGLTSIFTSDDRRPFTLYGKLQILHGAAGFGPLDVYVVPPGGIVQDALFGSLAPQNGFSEPLTLPPDTAYDLLLYDRPTATTVGGPLSITLSAGGIYSVLLVDSVGGSTVDPIPLDGF